MADGQIPLLIRLALSPLLCIMLADETTPVCQLGVIGLHKRSLILPDCRIVMPRRDLTVALLRVRGQHTLKTRQQSCASDRSAVAKNMRVDFNDLLSAGFYAAYKLLTVVIWQIRRRTSDRYSANWQSAARWRWPKMTFYVPAHSSSTKWTEILIIYMKTNARWGYKLQHRRRQSDCRFCYRFCHCSRHCRETKIKQKKIKV